MVQCTCFTIKTSRLCKYRKHSSLQIQVSMVFVAKKMWHKNLVKIYPNIHQGIMNPNVFHIRILSSVFKWHLLIRFFLSIQVLIKNSNMTSNCDFNFCYLLLWICRSYVSSIQVKLGQMYPKIQQTKIAVTKIYLSLLIRKI